MIEGSAASPRLVLPASVGAWSLAGERRRIEPAGIFAYMDGGGELYLGYRFDHIDVCEYATKAAGEDAILTEVYSLGGSDDAYGLLSQDWGGESVTLASDWPSGERRALYGAGLLRIWTGDVYARVMASLETAASRDAILAIGRALVANRPRSAPPALVGALPLDAAGRLRARLDRHVYLRSHLVLNSAFFVANANLLDLGQDVEAVIAPYDDAQRSGQASRTRLLLLRYPGADVARAALAHFQSVYLPNAAKAEHGGLRIEDGWTGWRLGGRALAVVFAATDEKAADALLNGVSLTALSGASLDPSSSPLPPPASESRRNP